MDQDNKLEEYKKKINELKAENKTLNTNLKEISLCCDDLKKERDVIFENYQQKIAENGSMQDNSNLQGMRKELLPIGNKPIKLSKLVNFKENDIIYNNDEYDEDIFTFSSYSSDDSIIYQIFTF